jgi:hypothetical protein
MGYRALNRGSEARARQSRAEPGSTRFTSRFLRHCGSPFRVDTVEEVADPFGLDGASRKRCRQAAGGLFSGRYWLRHWDELGEFP